MTPDLVGCDPIGRSHEHIVCANKIDNFVVTPDTHVDQVRLCCTPLVCVRATYRPVARPLPPTCPQVEPEVGEIADGVLNMPKKVVLLLQSRGVHGARNLGV